MISVEFLPHELERIISSLKETIEFLRTEGEKVMVKEYEGIVKKVERLQKEAGHGHK